MISCPRAPGQRRARVHVLQPREREQQRCGGPHVQPLGVHEQPATVPAKQALGPLVGYLPRVHQHPQVAEQRRHVSHADPPHYPDEGGREHLQRAPDAEEARGKQQAEHGHGQQPQAGKRDRAGERGAKPADRQQVQAGIAALALAAPHEQPDDDEGEGDGDGAADQEVAEGYRKVVALAEGVRASCGGEADQSQRGGERRRGDVAKLHWRFPVSSRSLRAVCGPPLRVRPAARRVRLPGAHLQHAERHLLALAVRLVRHHGRVAARDALALLRGVRPHYHRARSHAQHGR